MFTLAAMFTIVPIFLKQTKHFFICLISQCICIILAEIGRYMTEHLDRVHDQQIGFYIASIIVDLVFCLIIAPSIIYFAIKKTEDIVDGYTRKDTTISILSILVIVIFSVLLYNYVAQFEIADPPFIAFSFLLMSCAILLILTRKDVIKILIGTIFIENALFPLLVEASFIITLLLGLLTIFINIVGVHVVISGYQQYNSILIDVWKKETA
jgi:hypothetical protein